jgi:hypothetical protein
MAEETYAEIKKEFEETYNPISAKIRLERWLEANPDKAPKAKKVAKKESKKEE